MNNKIIETIESLKYKSAFSFSEYLKNKFENKHIVIYGAGAFGKEISNVLLQNNIYPSAFLDINVTQNIGEINVYHPENYKKKDSIVILAIVLNKHNRKEIETYIGSLGFNNIIDGQTIRAMYVELQGEHSYDYLKTKQNEILKPLDFLKDQESREIYTNNLIAHISRDYSLASESNDKYQYFADSIPFKKGFSSLIDCGAYIGDTFLEWVKFNKDIKEYFGFEPMMESYAKLVDTISKADIKSTAIPAAVSNKTNFISFDNRLGSSCINESGETLAMSIKLDDLLCRQTPTIIKMDIEGEEINALNGAKNLITNAKPELAISVYHYINHFWEIPNLIYDWNLDYDLYLRTHSSACMETVLYAVRKGE